MFKTNMENSRDRGIRVEDVSLGLEDKKMCHWTSLRLVIYSASNTKNGTCHTLDLVTLVLL